MDALNDTYVLLIEDNDDHILITKKMLNYVQENCNVEVIKDGEEAITYIKEKEGSLPDFILLDLGLPRASGIDVLKEFHANSRWAKIPIWLLTTWCDDVYLKQALDLGIEGYFEKPLGKHGIDSVKKLFETFQIRTN